MFKKVEAVLVFFALITFPIITAAVAHILYDLWFPLALLAMSVAMITSMIEFARLLEKTGKSVYFIGTMVVICLWVPLSKQLADEGGVLVSGEAIILTGFIWLALALHVTLGQLAGWRHQKPVTL